MRAPGLFLLIILPGLLCACAPVQPLHPDQLTYPPLAFEIPQVEHRTLANGLQLYLKEDHELPLVAITAMVGVGAIADDPEKTGQGELFAALLRSGGAGALGPAALDERLESLAADLSVSSDSYATTVHLSLQSDDLEQGLALLADLLRRPGFDATRLELARRQAIEGIRRQDDDPGAVAARKLQEALYVEHPLGRTPTVETVGAVTREDLIDLHQRFFHPNNLWLGVSGDFEPARLTAALQQTLGDWPEAPFEPQIIPPLTPAPAAAVWVVPKEIPQTSILLGEVGVSKDNPDLQAIRVMNYILGGGGFNSRLLREVRSNRGLAYSVYSYYQVGRRLPGLFIAGTETRSASSLEVVRLMRTIMDEIRNQPVSAADLQLAKESLSNSFIFAFDNPHEIITQKMRLDYYQYPDNYLEKYRDEIAAVTVEDVLRVARQYLHPEQQAVILVGDVEAFDEAPESLGLPVRRVTKTP